MIGIGRYNSMGIGLSVYLRDFFTPQAARINTAMTTMHNNQRRLLASNVANARAMSSSLLVAGAAFGFFMLSSVKQLAEFEKELSTVKAVTNDSTLSMAQLEEQIRKVGISTIFSVHEVARASTILGRAGFNRMQISQSLQATADLAAAANIPLEKSADSISQILATYDMAATRSGRVADLLTVAANKSIVNVTDLMESVKYSSSVATSLKIPFEDLLGILMKLGAGGIRGSMAGTSVANLLRYIAKASSEYRTGRQGQAMTMLGLTGADFQDAYGNVKSITELVDVFSTKLKDMPSLKALAAMEAITGVRGQRALEPLIKQFKNTKDVKEFIQLLNDPSTTGAARRIGKEMLDNVWGDLEILKENWVNFQIEIARLPGLRLFVKGLTRIVQIFTKIAQNPVGKFLLSVGVILTGVALTVGLLTKLMSYMDSLLISTTGFFRSMGLSAATAWGRATAGAMGYKAVAGTMGLPPGVGINRAGSLYNLSNGRIITPASAMGGSMGYSPFIMGGAGGRAPGAAFAMGRTLVNMGGLGRAIALLGRSAGLAAKFLGPISLALMAIFEIAQGNYGSAIGSLIGGLIGFFSGGGPLGAMVGGLVGMGFGSMFDKPNWLNEEEGDIYKNANDSRGRDTYIDKLTGKSYQSISPNEFFERFGNGVTNNGTPGNPVEVNINLDGERSMNKRIENSQDEDIYQSLGGGI